MANERRANPPGCSRTRCRRLTTGSRTAPVVPESDATVQRDGTVVAAAPAQKTRAAAFPFGRRLRSSVDAERVEGPGARFGCGAWPTSAEQGGTVRQVLGLDEQLAEGRVRHVVFLTPEHDLGVARDLDLSRTLALVGEREASDFHVLFGRDDHLELRLDAVVGASKHRALVRERDQVVVGFLRRGLVGRRPEPARADVAQVDEVAAGVGGSILAPARDREATPVAGAAAGVGDHGDVRAVREELRVRIEGVRRSEAPQARHRRDQRPPALLGGPRRFRRRLTRHPFLQEQLGRLDPRIAVEPRHHHIREQARWSGPPGSCRGGAPCRCARRRPADGSEVRVDSSDS